MRNLTIIGRNWLSLRYSGIALSVLLCVAAVALSQRYSGPAMLFAVLIGLALHSCYDSKKLQPGIDWCAKPVAKIGVALLGFRVDFSDIGQIGISAMGLAITSLVITILFGTMAAKLVGVSRRFGVLISGAVSICGVSAAIAISSVLPKNNNSNKELALTVAGVSVISTAAMILYPIISEWLNHTDIQAGIFMGASIHDVAQVVGAGYSVSDNSGDTAIFVKLIRVSTLLPVVLVIAYLFNGRSVLGTENNSRYFPWFLFVYFIIAAANSFHLFPQLIQNLGVGLSILLLTTSIVANGLKTNVSEFVLLGRGPLILLIVTTVFIAIITLLGISFI